MNEKDPFEKYDKLFDEQDKKHDQQVKAYRRETKINDKPTFEVVEKEDQRDHLNSSNQSSKGVIAVIGVVIAVLILRVMVFNSETIVGGVIPVLIFIGIMTMIRRYLKNKR